MSIDHDVIFQSCRAGSAGETNTSNLHSGNSLLFNLQYTTTSMRNAASRNEIISSSTAPPLSLSGANFVPGKFTLCAVN